MTVSFGGVSGRLPKGIHNLTWAEAEELLAYNPRRKLLMSGLLEACYSLRAAGVTQIFVDGSFVTKKANPGDWDACYVSKGVNPYDLDPVFLDFANDRAAQKAKYGGEAFPAEADATGFGEPYLSFFQQTPDGKQKGIVAIGLDSLP